MPFQGTDSFCIYGIETEDGLRAVSDIVEDSVQSSHFCHTRKADSARRHIEKKDKSSGNKENLEVTISEDLTDGHSTHLDASLKLLEKDELKLQLPSDQVEDDKIHIIETTVGAAQRPNHAMQDY